MKRSSSSSTELVLSYSHNASLLLTRRWLLEHMVVRCRCAGSSDEFRSALLAEVPDLIMLCQTLTHAECSEAKQLAQQHAPGVRLVVLHAHAETCAGENDLSLDSSGGPELFLRTTRCALAERSSALGKQSTDRRHARGSAPSLHAFAASA